MFIKDYELLGFIQGDGTLTDMRNIDKKGIGISVGRDDYDVNSYFNLNVPKDEIVVYYTDNKIINMIINLGFKIETLPFRSLPTTFDNWTELEKLSFVRGIFSANGTCLKGYGRVSFKSTCYKLIEELKFYLEGLGMTPNITTNKAKVYSFKNGDYLSRESYDLNINKMTDRILYYENIGFIQQYKMDKLKDSIITKVDKSTGVGGVRLELSGKYSANVKYIDKTYKFGLFDSFDEAVKMRVAKELIKSDLKRSTLFNQNSNTLQLTYLSHDDQLTTHIEISLQGEILQFTKQSPITP